MEYRELEQLVIKWADSRGIFEKGNPTAQALKTVEEADELVDAIDKQDREEVVDALGDILGHPSFNIRSIKYFLIVAVCGSLLLSDSI